MSPDPDALRVLTVHAGPDELRGVLLDPVRLGHVLATPYTGDPAPWAVELTEPAEDRVRFVATSQPGAGPEAQARGSFSFATAPQELGTEVSLALDLDGPDLAAGAMAHKALRRLKALAETGEIPTLAHNTSAREDQGDLAETPEPTDGKY